MNDAFRLPDARLARMIAGWPPFDDAEIERIALEIPLGSKLSDARRWMAQCRSILPLDQTIVSDYQTMVMLEHSAAKTDHVGVDGRIYWFGDGSRIVSNSMGDRTYPL